MTSTPASRRPARLLWGASALAALAAGAWLWLATTACGCVPEPKPDLVVAPEEAAPPR